MQFSCQVKYALLALIELSSVHQQEDFLSIEKIAAAQKIPERYVAQILATLRHGGLIRSQKGGKGGYLLARAPQQITLFDVWNCLQGTQLEPQLMQRTDPPPPALSLAMQSEISGRKQTKLRSLYFSLTRYKTYATNEINISF